MQWIGGNCTKMQPHNAKVIRKNIVPPTMQILHILYYLPGYCIWQTFILKRPFILSGQRKSRKGVEFLWKTTKRSMRDNLPELCDVEGCEGKCDGGSQLWTKPQ